MRRIRPRRLARNGLMEFRLWLGEVRVESHVAWRKRRHRALDAVDGVVFEVERLTPRLRGNRLARGLAATAVLAAGGAAAALVVGSGGRPAGHPEAAAVRPAQPAAKTVSDSPRATDHAAHAARTRHAPRAPKHHARRARSAPTAAATTAPSAPPPAVPQAQAPRPASPAPSPPRRAPAPSHHTGGGGQAVQFDSSG